MSHKELFLLMSRLDKLKNHFLNDDGLFTDCANAIEQAMESERVIKQLSTQLQSKEYSFIELHKLSSRITAYEAQPSDN